MTTDIYDCSLLTDNEEDARFRESISARSPKQAANMFKLAVSSKGGGPGNIRVSNGTRRYDFGWDLTEKKAE